MNLNDSHVAVLTALRGAEMLRRQPTTLSADGHQHWWSLGELAAEGRVRQDDLAGLSRAARGLYKGQLVLQRTQFTRVRFCLTDDGRRALCAYEAAHGLAGLRTAQLALAQAREDLWQAQNALEKAAAAIVPAETLVRAEQEKLEEANGS